MARTQARPRASQEVILEPNRYEELLALSLTDPKRLQERPGKHGQVILALDGLQPDVGQEVLWVLRGHCSGKLMSSFIKRLIF